MLRYPAIGNRYKVIFDSLFFVNLIDLLCSICMPVNISSNIVSYFEELAALITNTKCYLVKCFEGGVGDMRPITFGVHIQT